MLGYPHPPGETNLLSSAKEEFCMYREERIANGSDESGEEGFAAVPVGPVSQSGTNGEGGGRLSEWSRSRRTRWGAGVRLYVLVVGVVGASTALRLALDPLFGEAKQFIMYYPAIAMAALVGGARAGVMATVLSALAVDVLFVQPRGSLLVVRLSDGVALGVFAISGGLLSWMAERVNRTRKEEAEALERKRGEEALRAKEAELELVTNAVPSLIFCLDAEQRYVFCNDAFSEWFGVERAQVLGRTVREFVGDVAWELIEPKLARAYAGETVEYEAQAPYRHGGTRWIHAIYTPRRDASRRVVGVVVLINNATEQKRGEEVVREQVALLNLAHDAIIVFDAGGKATFWSNGAEETYGWKREEALGRVKHELLKTRFPRPLAELRAEVAEKGSWEGELTHTRKDGLEIVVASRWSAQRNGEGEQIGVLEINRDITERKRVEEALRTSESTLRSFYDSAPLMMGVVEVLADDSDIMHVYNNPATKRFFGLGDTVGQSALGTGAPKEVVKLWIERYRLAEREKRPVQFEYLHPQNSGGAWLSAAVAKIGPGGGGRTKFSYAVADVTERKQMEEALMAKEAELELILRSTPFMLTRCSRDLRYLYASRAYAEMIGRNQEVVAGRSIAEIMGEKGFATIKPYVEAALHGERVRYESDIDFEGVGIRHLAVTYVPEVDEGGRVVGWIASMIDMTAQRRAEKVLAETQDRLALALEAAGGAMWGWNIPDNRLDEWDPIYRKLFGFSGEEPPRVETWLARLHPEDRQRLAKRLEQMLRTPEDDIWDEEFRILHPERGERWIFGLGKCLRDGFGKALRMTGVCVDVTERREAQEVLRRNKEELTRKQAELLVLESERRFILLANSAPVLIWASGPDKLCTFFNQPWLNFTGRSLEKELGNGWAEGVHADDLAECLKVYNESFDARRSFIMDYRLRRHDGQYRWISDHGVPRYDAQGVFLGYIGSCVDVSERKHAEAEAQRAHQELARVSRVSTLGELAGSLAHELNQPLAAILCNAQAGQRFLKDGRASLDEIQEILNDIILQDRRAGEIIVRIRAMLRKGEIQVTPLELNKVIWDVLGLMHVELLSRKVTISTRLAQDLPLVSADRVQLQQVFLNLIVNACDAISGNVASDRRLTITSELVDAKHVRASVTDIGTGFAPEVLERIFEPFLTTKPSGLGLGLPICRSIIHAHGGEICAENGKERGATVRFTLTVHKEEVP